MNPTTFWLLLGLIVVAYMSLWFAVAQYTKRLDVVDSAWGLGFVVVAWASIWLNDSFGLVPVMSAALVTVWGLRLFVHIARRNWRKHEDDYRYTELRLKWGRAEKRKAYTNVYLLQGFLLTLVSAPMIAITSAENPALNIGVVIGWGVWLFGICYEAIADHQLARFLKQPKASRPEIMDRGLWRTSRHPNYFGEITTWWGASIVAASVGGWWGAVGALTITLLIVRVSGLPPLERRYKDNPAYQKYSHVTSVLVPLPRRKEK